MRAGARQPLRNRDGRRLDLDRCLHVDAPSTSLLNGIKIGENASPRETFERK